MNICVLLAEEWLAYLFANMMKLIRVWLSVPVVGKLTSSALFLPQAYQAEKIAFQNQENHLMIPTY